MTGELRMQSISIQYIACRRSYSIQLNKLNIIRLTYYYKLNDIILNCS